MATLKEAFRQAQAHGATRYGSVAGPQPISHMLGRGVEDQKGWEFMLAQGHPDKRIGEVRSIDHGTGTIAVFPVYGAKKAIRKTKKSLGHKKSIKSRKSTKRRQKPIKGKRAKRHARGKAPKRPIKHARKAHRGKKAGRRKVRK